MNPSRMRSAAANMRAKSHGEQARKQTDQQRSRQQPPPLLVRAQKVAHLALHHPRGGGVATVPLRATSPTMALDHSHKSNTVSGGYRSPQPAREGSGEL